MMETTPTNTKMSASLIVAFIALFLVPIFVLPGSILSVAGTKAMLIAIGACIALGAYFFKSMRTKESPLANIHPHARLLLYSFGLFFVAYVISSLVSGYIAQTFIGTGFERDSVMAVVLFGLLFLLGLLVSKTTRIVWRFWQIFVGAFALLATFSILRILIGADVIFPSFFSLDPTAIVLGSWNDLAVYAGAVLLMIHTALVSGMIKRGLNAVVSYTLLAVAIIALLFVNLSVVWSVLAILSLGIGIYAYTQNKNIRTTPVIVSAGIFIFTAVFAIWGSTLGGFLANTFNIQYVDVRPSLDGTYSVVKEVYTESALFGSGPNTFAADWALHKPQGVYMTDFWNVDFGFGMGIVPTFFATAGILGGLLFAIFTLVALFIAVRVFLRNDANPFVQYLSSAFAASSIFLVVLLWVYVPGIVLLAYTFLFVGITAALHGMAPASMPKTDEDLPEPSSYGLLQKITAMLGVLVCALAFLAYADRTTAQVLLNRASLTEDIEKAERLVVFADSIDSSPLYANAQAQIHAARIQEIVNTQPETEEERAALVEQLQQEIDAMLEDARSATESYEKNYRSWIALGNTYASLVPLNVEGAYENALLALNNAHTYSPNNPLVYLGQATIAQANEDVALAEEYANKAIAVKENYTDAYYFLADLYIQQNRVPDAIAASEAVVLLAPNNPYVAYRLGVLQFASAEYEKAQPVLERAVILMPDYANAIYFLGLSYDALGNSEAALAAFSRLAELNPENEEVQDILQRLESGMSVMGVTDVDAEVQDALSEEATTE